MKTKCVITIGREFCSGGAAIAHQVSELLEIPYYDKEIIDGAMEISNLPEHTVSRHDEQPVGYFSVGYQYGYRWYTEDPSLLLPVGMRVADAQFEYIHRIAQQGPCVIVGRCADFVLEDMPNTLDVFVRSDIDTRMKVAQKRFEMNAGDAKRLIRKTDKIRSNYYRYYTQHNWGSAENYDLILDTGKISWDVAAKIIAYTAEHM